MGLMEIQLGSGNDCNFLLTMYNKLSDVRRIEIISKGSGTAGAFPEDFDGRAAILHSNAGWRYFFCSRRRRDEDIFFRC